LPRIFQYRSCGRFDIDRGQFLVAYPVIAIDDPSRFKKIHHICKEKPMPELSHIDPRSAALLVMDYQVDTLTRFMTAAQSADAIACVPDLIAMARDAGMMVIHVVVTFRPGHPEVSPRQTGWRWPGAKAPRSIRPQRHDRGNR
jgi:hypothetical protein